MREGFMSCSSEKRFWSSVIDIFADSGAQVQHISSEQQLMAFARTGRAAAGSFDVDAVQQRRRFRVNYGEK